MSGLGPIEPPDRTLLTRSNPLRHAPPLLVLAAGALFVAAMILVFRSRELQGAAFAQTFGGGVICGAGAFFLAERAKRLGLRRMAELEPELLKRREALEQDLKHTPSRTNKAAAIFVLVIAGVFSIGGLVVEAFLLQRYLSFPSSPRQATLEATKPNEFVQLTGATLDCDSRFQSGDHTYFIGRSLGGRPVIARYDEPTTCEAARAHLVGVVSRFDPDFARRLAQRGFVVPAGDVAELCTWCRPQNTLKDMQIVLGLIGMGLVFGWFGVAELRKQRALLTTSR